MLDLGRVVGRAEAERAGEVSRRVLGRVVLACRYGPGRRGVRGPGLASRAGWGWTVTAWGVVGVREGAGRRGESGGTGGGASGRAVGSGGTGGDGGSRIGWARVGK